MQPYYLAWYGFFEQIKLADIYVFYDDVQYVKRSLMSRVSIATPRGPNWITVPLSNVHQGDLLCNVRCNDKSGWRKDHLNQLSINYKNAPFFNDMYSLATKILSHPGDRLSEVTVNAIRKICQFYDLDKDRSFHLSSDLKIPGSGTVRLVNITKELGADKYLTGMGGLNYLDYNLFEKNSIEVEFINYSKTEYPQASKVFNPYVSIMDLIAFTSGDGLKYFKSLPIYYRDFVKTEDAINYLKSRS